MNQFKNVYVDRTPVKVEAPFGPVTVVMINSSASPLNSYGILQLPTAADVGEGSFLILVDAACGLSTRPIFVRPAQGEHLLFGVADGETEMDMDDSMLVLKSDGVATLIVVDQLGLA